MRYLIISLSLALTSLLEAHDYTGVTFGGGADSESEVSDMFEINYIGRPHQNMTIYAGYAWLKLPELYGYSLNDSISIHGTQVGLLVHPDLEFIRPYIGLGLYSGQTRYCDSGYRYCDYQGAFAIYPEAGIQFSFGRHLQVSAKVRRYEFDRSDIADETMGIISLSFFYD